MMTSDGLNYLKAINCKHWVYDHLYNSCWNFKETFGFGSEEFLVCVGLWCKFFMETLSMDIPHDVLHVLALEILHSTFNEIESSLSPQTVAVLKQQQNKQVIQKPPKVNFSRYSRHVMQEITQDEQFSKDKSRTEIFRKLVENFIEEGTDMYSIMLELLTEIHLDQKPKSLHELQISSDHIIIDSLNTTPSFKKRVFDGVLVSCNGHEYFEMVENYNGMKTRINIILLNRIAYGDTLDDSLKIIEVTKFDAIRESPLNRNEPCFSLLKEFDVHCVFYRGDLDTRLIQYCNHNRIYLIVVTDYDVMFRLHSLTGVCILFEVTSHFQQSDVANVEIDFHTVCFKVDEPISKRIVREKPTCGYINIRNLSVSKERFYSVILSSRGRDMQFLKCERFHNILQRLSFLINSSTVTNEMVERKVISRLKHYKGITTNIYEKPLWMENDLSLFSNLISKQIVAILQTFVRIIDIGCDESIIKNRSRIDNLKFKKNLWINSLECLERVLTTISMDTNIL